MLRTLELFRHKHRWSHAVRAATAKISKFDWGHIMEKISLQNWTRILNLHHMKRILTPSARRPFSKLDFEIFVVFYRTKTYVWIEITPAFWDIGSQHFQVCYNTILSIKRDQGIPHLTSPHAEGTLWKRDFGKIHHIGRHTVRTCRPVNRLQASSGRVVCNGQPIAAQHSTAVAAVAQLLRMVPQVKANSFNLCKFRPQYLGNWNRYQVAIISKTLPLTCLWTSPNATFWVYFIPSYMASNYH